MAGGLNRSLTPRAPGEKTFTPEEMGYKGNEKATAFIQAAIEAAHAAGGGTVLLSGGDYVSGTLDLRSRVRLQVGAGARLLGSADLADYPERHAKRLTVQDTSMGMHQSLLFAEDCEDIAVCGPGEINGRGSPLRFPGAETAQGTPGRPFVMRVIDCRRVRISGLTLRDSPCWMQNYLNCEDLLIEDVTVRNHANYNNDGLDIDGCRRVIVRRCSIHSGDDALCFKGASQRDTRDVLVEDCELFSACNAVKVGTDTQGGFGRIWVRNCRIGGLAEDPSGLKHAWCDAAVSLEMVDGGLLEDFLLSDLTLLSPAGGPRQGQTRGSPPGNRPAAARRGPAGAGPGLRAPGIVLHRHSGAGDRGRLPAGRPDHPASLREAAAAGKRRRRDAGRIPGRAHDRRPGGRAGLCPVGTACPRPDP